MLAASHTGGQDGVYLKQVRGPVLLARGETSVFDPASAIKVTIHLRTLLDVANVNPLTGAPYRQLTDSVSIPATRNGSCPVFDGNVVSKPLAQSLSDMMKLSTNEDPGGLRQILGPAELDRAIAAFGMGDTHYLFPTGCNRNQTTLQDLGRLYESVSRGLLEARRADFEALAWNVPLFEIDPIVDAQVAVDGLPADFRARYRTRVVSVEKGGAGGDAGGQKRIVAGLMSLPTCSAGALGSRDYVYGVFFENASAIGVDPSGAGEFNLNRIVAEMLRDEIGRAVHSFAEGGCRP
jgi:hypothetical protein